MRSVTTSLQVFETIARRQPIGLSAIARELDTPKATVQRSLLALADRGWIVQDLLGAGRWSVSAQLSVLAEPAPALQAVRAFARPHLIGLRERTGEAAALFTIDGDHMAMVDGYGDLRVVRDLEAQRGRFPIHASGAGRAMLAALPVARRVELVDRLADLGMASYTDQTVTDRDELLALVADVHPSGWAVVDGEYLPGLASVGAAIVDPTGLPVAALAVMVTSRPDPGRSDRALRAIGRELVRVTTQVSDLLADERIAPRPGHRTRS